MSTPVWTKVPKTPWSLSDLSVFYQTFFYLAFSTRFKKGYSTIYTIRVCPSDELVLLNTNALGAILNIGIGAQRRGQLFFHD